MKSIINEPRISRQLLHIYMCTDTNSLEEDVINTIQIYLESSVRFGPSLTQLNKFKSKHKNIYNESTFNY